MIKRKQIEQVVNAIVTGYHPQKVIMAHPINAYFS